MNKTLTINNIDANRDENFPPAYNLQASPAVLHSYAMNEACVRA